MKELKELHDNMKEHAPLLKCMSASMGEMKHCPKYVGVIDVLATNDVYAESKNWCTQNQVDFTVYSYLAARIKASSSRLSYGFQPWQYDPVLINGWALRWYNGNPFNDLDSKASDWCVVCPNWTGSPISSPSWEGLREGVNDQRYMALYEQLVKDKKANGDLLQKFKEKGIGLIKMQSGKIVGDSVFGANAENATDLEVARDKVIDEILKALKQK